MAVAAGPEPANRVTRAPASACPAAVTVPVSELLPAPGALDGAAAAPRRAVTAARYLIRIDYMSLFTSLRAVVCSVYGGYLTPGSMRGLW